MTSRPPPPDVIARRVSGPRARDVATRRASVAVMTVHAGVRGPDLLGCDAKLAKLDSDRTQTQSHHSQL